MPPNIHGRQEVKELEQENNKELKINQLLFTYFLSPWLCVYSHYGEGHRRDTEPISLGQHYR